MNNRFDYATSVGSIKTLKDYAEIYSETIFELVQTTVKFYLI